jgi:hypothetical protein
MTIRRYDPLKAPDPERWLAMDEQVRMDLALAYHENAGIEVPGMSAHAALHAVVENQIAIGDETPVQRKLQQLMAQGLDRHEAIHAIASVLIKHLANVSQGRLPSGDPNKRYYAALARLNAKKWLRSG